MPERTTMNFDVALPLIKRGRNHEARYGMENDLRGSSDCVLTLRSARLVRFGGTLAIYHLNYSLPVASTKKNRRAQTPPADKVGTYAPGFPSKSKPIDYTFSGICY